MTKLLNLTDLLPRRQYVRRPARPREGRVALDATRRGRSRWRFRCRASSTGRSPGDRREPGDPLPLQQRRYQCDLPRPWYYRKRGDSELSTAEFERIIDELAELGIAGVSITGGEPRCGATTDSAGAREARRPERPISTPMRSRWSSRSGSMRCSPPASIRSTFRSTARARRRTIGCAEHPAGSIAWRGQPSPPRRSYQAPPLDHVHLRDRHRQSHRIDRVHRAVARPRIDSVGFMPVFDVYRDRTERSEEARLAMEASVARLREYKRGEHQAFIDNTDAYLSLFGAAWRGEPSPLRCYAPFTTDLLIDSYGNVFPCALPFSNGYCRSATFGPAASPNSGARRRIRRGGASSTAAAPAIGTATPKRISSTSAFLGLTDRFLPSLRERHRPGALRKRRSTRFCFAARSAPAGSGDRRRRRAHRSHGRDRRSGRPLRCAPAPASVGVQCRPARARNEAIRSAGGALFLLVDADCIVDRAGCGCTGRRNGGRGCGRRGRRAPFDRLRARRRLLQLVRLDSGPGDGQPPFDHLPTANLSVARAVFERVGLFREGDASTAKRGVLRARPARRRGSVVRPLDRGAPPRPRLAARLSPSPVDRRHPDAQLSPRARRELPLADAAQSMERLARCRAAGGCIHGFHRQRVARFRPAGGGVRAADLRRQVAQTAAMAVHSRIPSRADAVAPLLPPVAIRSSDL